MKERILLLDYGVGNLYSIANALKKVGGQSIDLEVSCDPQAIKNTDRLILPGVGHFSACMQALNNHPKCLVQLKQIIGTRPVLGICVGMQLLFQQSEESDGFSRDDHAAQGLGFFNAQVTSFQKAWRLSEKKNQYLKSPQMGWNQIHLSDHAKNSALFKNIKSGDFVYYANSFFVPLHDNTLAYSHHGVDLTAVVGPHNLSKSPDHLYGFQFHPEKSSKVGLEMLRNFLFEIHS